MMERRVCANVAVRAGQGAGYGGLALPGSRGQELRGLHAARQPVHQVRSHFLTALTMLCIMPQNTRQRKG